MLLLFKLLLLLLFKLLLLLLFKLNEFVGLLLFELEFEFKLKFVGLFKLLKFWRFVDVVISDSSIPYFPSLNFEFAFSKGSSFSKIKKSFLNYI